MGMTSNNGKGIISIGVRPSEVISRILHAYFPDIKSKSKI